MRVPPDELSHSSGMERRGDMGGMIGESTTNSTMRIMRSLTTIKRCHTVLALLSIIPLCHAAQDATISEVEQTLLTYPFSDVSPLANIGRIYPYTRFDGYSATGRSQTWKLVKLENDYLTVWVAPQIGGKVWRAIDKVTGRAFIYDNPVVKFRDVGMRGPWTAGGLEFNFGVIGHAPTCAAPVDHVLRHDADGGVSCVIGALDLPSRTRWTVVIRLPRDSAAFETEASWYNPTVFHQSCYQWMTAAAEAGDDLTLYHPGHHYLEHGGAAQTWPQDAAGHTLSLYRDNAFGGPKSYHVVGAQAEWFGGYWSGRASGYGRWSLFGDKPGQKLWLWSLSREGAIWRDLLTDAPMPQYIEMQSGLMHSQADDTSSATPFKHAALEPGAALHWNELWFPLGAIGGMVDASPWGALNAIRIGNRLVVSVCPLRPLDAELRVTVAGALVHHQRLTAAPLAVLNVPVELAERVGVVAVEIGDHLLSWRSDDDDRRRLNRPLVIGTPAAVDSAEGLFIAGEEHLRQRDLAQALASFTRCVAAEPGHVRALTRLAELRSARGEREQALTAARQALSLDATDAGANFFYGVANVAIGQVADAKDGFAWAARSPALRMAANAQLATLSIHEHDWWRAAAYAERGASDAAEGEACRFLQAVIARLRGDAVGAADILTRILARDPLHHGARWERFMLTQRPESLAAFMQPIRGEAPQETLVEMAAQYAALGLDDAALAILEQSPTHPLVAYWQAYLRRERNPAASDSDLERAVSASPRAVFMSRVETIAVLRWAEQRRSAWQTAYYLGMLLWSLGREDEARVMLERCATTPDSAAFYLNRSRLYRADAERPLAIADLRRAQSADQREWRACHLLVRALLEAGDIPQALAEAEQAQQTFADNQALTMDLAQAQLAAGRFHAVLATLAAATVLPFEGAYEGRDLYRRANLFATIESFTAGDTAAATAFVAAARTWPERLGSGRPYDPDERLEDFLVARLARAAGDAAGAKQAYARIAAFTAQQKPGSNCVSLISAIALRELGNVADANAVLAEWRRRAPADATYWPWAKAIYDGDAAAAAAALLDAETHQPRTVAQLGRKQRDFPLVDALVGLR